MAAIDAGIKNTNCGCCGWRWHSASAQVVNPSRLLCDRLTDEKWQTMVNAGKAPPPPIWTSSFLLGKSKPSPK